MARNIICEDLHTVVPPLEELPENKPVCIPFEEMLEDREALDVMVVESLAGASPGGVGGNIGIGVGGGFTGGGTTEPSGTHWC